MAVLIRPVVFIWTSDGRMAPMPRFKKICDAQFIVGEEYPLTLLEARSRNSHNHFFATVHEAWKNLPEDIASDFPSTEHLRKWALCKTGWSTMKTFPCETHDHARNLAIFARSADEFAVIEVRGNIVRIHQAKSQSAAAMGKDEFQKSKTDVLDKIAELIEVTPKQLRREGERQFPEPRR
jgi:hypothetical protein